jgi:hypothetical protein
MLVILAVLIFIGLLWAVPHFHLRGKDLSAYDMPIEASMSSDPPTKCMRGRPE